jgi:hypothetical protein
MWTRALVPFIPAAASLRGSSFNLDAVIAHTSARSS